MIKTKNLPVCIEQHGQLLSVKRKTGMSLSYILGMAISEWLIKHEPGIYEQGVALHRLNQEAGKAIEQSRFRTRSVD